MSVIQVKNLSKQYKDLKALKDLSFDVLQSECVGLLGSNGAGKSTAIKIFIGQMQPSSGSVNILGINPSKEPKKVLPFIGYVPDNLTIYDEITVEQNIEIFRQIHRLPKERTIEIIQKMGLTDKTKTKVKALSRGLKQRVLIARSLIQNPKVVFLDEPTTGLDPNAAEVIYKILEDLKKGGATIFLTTHLMNDVERLCDKIIFLNQGEKIEEGTPFELKRKYRNPSVEVKVMNKEKQIKTIKLLMDENLLGNLSRIQLNEKIESIKTHEPKLEEIFIQLLNK